MSKVIVIGGGAAGMMAAIAAAQKGNKVILLEKNEKLGKKLFITGKGRCNVTNAADMDVLFQNICTNEKFLYSAFYGFDNTRVCDLLEQAGCPLKTSQISGGCSSAYRGEKDPDEGNGWQSCFLWRGMCRP